MSKEPTDIDIIQVIRLIEMHAIIRQPFGDQQVRVGIYPLNKKFTIDDVVHVIKELISNCGCMSNSFIVSFIGKELVKSVFNSPSETDVEYYALEHTTFSDARFGIFFANCTSITNADDMPLLSRHAFLNFKIHGLLKTEDGYQLPIDNTNKNILIDLSEYFQ